MEYQRVCRAFIPVIFADSSKGVSPVKCLQYRYFLKARFFVDTIKDICMQFIQAVLPCAEILYSHPQMLGLYHVCSWRNEPGKILGVFL